MTLLRLQDIWKSFDGKAVLNGVSLDVEPDEILVMLGPSGCGKTTLLRIIAGLETAERGELSLDAQDLTRVPIHERGFGMVFQDYALFPHKNVFDNVAFGLKMQGWPAERQRVRVRQVLDLVGLPAFGRRAVYDLSGGEQQRVALARALAPAPRLLLLDEPLGSLDRALRERLMGDLRLILKEAGGVMDRPEGITAVYVTHDQEEAFAVADRIVVMNQGAVEQIGVPTELYRRPRNDFVARFLGMDNLLEAQIVSVQPAQVSSALGTLLVADLASKQPGEPASLLIRPGAGRLLEKFEEVTNVIAGTLVRVSFRGRHLVAHVAADAPGTDLVLKLEFPSTTTLPSPGERMRIGLDPSRLVVLE